MYFFEPTFYYVSPSVFFLFYFPVGLYVEETILFPWLISHRVLVPLKLRLTAI